MGLDESQKFEQLISELIATLSKYKKTDISQFNTGVKKEDSHQEEFQLTLEHIIWAYRLFLDREPENVEIIDKQLATHSNTGDLRKSFLNSLEFRGKNQGQISCFLSLTGSEPKLDIEAQLNEDVLGIIFNHIQDTWNYFGQTEPHWSVLTSEQFRQSNINETKEIFYESGKSNVMQLLSSLERNGLNYSAYKSCLEYGCGLGRITRWLSEKFDSVFGYDISKSHLEAARHLLENEKIDNVTLCHVRELKDLENLPKVDLIYSVIVLQHNPPPIIALIIRQFIKALNPGGVAYFQVPTYRIGYRFSVEQYLTDEAKRREMEMHVLPQSTIFEVVREEGGKIIEVLEDSWTGLRYKERSNTFIIKKE